MKKTIEALELKNMLITASRKLRESEEELNELNIYPVPDGDTGTNMAMTMEAVEKALISNDNLELKELIDLVQEAVLLGARGNSGTILSQIIIGMMDGLNEPIGIDDFVRALGDAKEKAYSSVSQAVEGTILTLVRRAFEEGEKLEGQFEDFISFFEELLKRLAFCLENTKELLPKLKEADVVDAGAKGFVYLLEGFLYYLRTEELLDIEIDEIENRNMENYSEEEIKYHYCTEFIIDSGDLDEEELKAFLLECGDSLVVAKGKRKTKIHIHTNNPGLALEKGISYGAIENIKIDNMHIQHKNLLVELEEVKIKNILINPDKNIESGIIAVADSEENAEFFFEKGAEVVIFGGQSKNSSVAEVLEAIGLVKGKEIRVLPNNKNIIKSCELAIEKSDKNCLLIETKSILEGIYVCDNVDEEIDEIYKGLSRNYSIEITKAVRETVYNGLEIRKGDFLVIVNGKIVKTGQFLKDLTYEIIDNYIDENSLSITVLKGKDGLDLELKRDIENVYKYGGQENYYYYIYIERKNENIGEVAIVTDSTSDLDLKNVKNLPISLVPLNVSFGKENYKDGVDLSRDEFWEKVYVEGLIPKTAQPSPSEFINVYNKLFKKGYKKIISIHISSKLSGTIQAANVAKNMTKHGESIEIVDGESISMGLGHLALEAAKKALDGNSTEEIISKIDHIKKRGVVYAALTDIEYLEKNGRIGKAGSFTGNMLNVKPIIKIEDGEVTTDKKAFGDKGALKYFEKILKEESKKGSLVAYVAWGGKDEELKNARELIKIVEKQKGISYRGLEKLGAVIGSHGGPLYGVILYPKLI